MIGFIIGTVCLIGLVKTLRHGGWGFAGHGWGGCGSGRSLGGQHGCHGARSGRDGWGRRSAMRFLFERLDTTPGQEKVILTSVDAVRAAGDNTRRELKKARSEAAASVRGEELDHSALASASARMDAAGQALREALSTALLEIHAVLDDDQRRRLGELIEDGPGFFDRFAGPYRSRGEVLVMRRKILIVLFSLGAIAGFGSEFARGACHARRGGHGRQAFEAHVARTCADAALRTREVAPPREAPPSP